MVITYYGVSCFKIQSGDMILVLDPPSKKSVFRSPRFQADLVFVSQDHPDHNGFENVVSKEKNTLLVDGPGEYEIRGISIKGVIGSNCNTIYIFTLDSVSFCYLGDETDLPVGELSNIDVLFVPDISKTDKTINQIAPKIIIPTDKAGSEKSTPVEKFTFKKKDIADKKGEVVVLKPLIN